MVESGHFPHWDMEPQFQEWAQRQGPSWIPSTDSPVCIHPLWRATSPKLDTSSSRTRGCEGYQPRRSTRASPSAHRLTLSSASLPFDCTFLVSTQWKPAKSIYIRFHTMFLSLLILGMLWVCDLSPPTKLQSTFLFCVCLSLANPTLLGRTLSKTLSALSLHCSKYV